MKKHEPAPDPVWIRDSWWAQSITLDGREVRKECVGFSVSQGWVMLLSRDASGELVQQRGVDGRVIGVAKSVRWGTVRARGVCRARREEG